MWDLANAAFIKRNVYNIKCLLLNEENSQINDFSLYLKKLRKEQQIKPKERRKELIAILHKLFQKIEKEGILSNSFWGHNCLILKSDEGITWGGNYRPHTNVERI